MKQTWSDLELQQKCRRWCPGPGNTLGQHPGRGGGEGGCSRKTGPGPGCRTFSGFRGERHPALFRSKRRLLPLKSDKAEQYQEDIWTVTAAQATPRSRASSSLSLLLHITLTFSLAEAAPDTGPPARSSFCWAALAAGCFS